MVKVVRTNFSVTFGKTFKIALPNFTPIGAVVHPAGQKTKSHFNTGSFLTVIIMFIANQ